MITRENCDLKKLNCYLDSCAKGCILARQRTKEKERTERNERALESPEYVLAHWKQIVRDIELTDTCEPPQIQERYRSELDKGFFVFAVLRNQAPVHVGICEGRGRKRTILAAQKRYQGTVAIILAYGLPHTQAQNMRRALKRKLHLEKSE